MRGKTRERDGIYQRDDRPGWWISFTDSRGQRKRRKIAGAHTLQQARIYGIAPPTPETFTAISARYLKHQKPG